MGFDWADFLTLAKELAKRTEESAQRTAISRAYYAAYGIACHFVRREKVAIPSQGSHDFVWNHFRNSTDSDRRQIGIDGDRIKRTRRNADYDHDWKLLSAFLNPTIESADELIRALTKLREDKPHRSAPQTS
jgi:hypothetical protein